MIKDAFYVGCDNRAKQSTDLKSEAALNLPVSLFNGFAKCYTTKALTVLAQINHTLRLWDVILRIISSACNEYVCA